MVGGGQPAAAAVLIYAPQRNIDPLDDSVRPCSSGQTEGTK
jgi:hypothetical protein